MRPGEHRSRNGFDRHLREQPSPLHRGLPHRFRRRHERHSPWPQDSDRGGGDAQARRGTFTRSVLQTKARRDNQRSPLRHL